MTHQRKKLIPYLYGMMNKNCTVKFHYYENDTP